MSSDIDPAATAAGAFTDLIKRVLVFCACFASGLLCGLMAGGVNHLIFGGKAKVVKEAAEIANEIGYESVTSGFPSPSVVLLSILSVGCLLGGLALIVKGGTKVLYYVLAFFGAAVLAQLIGRKWDWSMGIISWILIGAFTAGAYVVIKKWRVKQDEQWQAELDAIYEENRLKREAKVRAEEEAAEAAVAEDEAAEAARLEAAEEAAANPPEEEPEKEPIKIASILEASKTEKEPKGSSETLEPPSEEG